ncbi:MAG: PHP domain-containing protein [Halobacteriales archaeon]
MTVADLHVHTDNSDGVLSLDAVPAAACDVGLQAVAITDHDRPHPDLDAPVVEMDGVTVIHGIELRVDSAAGRIDLLGYGLDPTPALSEEVARLQRDRLERGAAIIDRVESRLCIDLGIEPHEGIGRPHIARAIADHPATEHDFSGAFRHLIGDDGPCYVARSIPSFEHGRALLAEACSIVGLAHPLRYDDPGAALDHVAGLDAVERWYPYGRPVDIRVDRSPDRHSPGTVEANSINSSVDPYTCPVLDAISAHDLLATGGSDAHGETLGATGLTADAYRQVSARLPDPP